MRSNKRKTTEQFIEEATRIHGDKFDYRRVVYKDAHTPVSILCKKCNIFFHQPPNSHLKGKGCARCTGKVRKTATEFLFDLWTLHLQDDYDLSRVVYKGNKAAVELVCLKTGLSFFATPNNLLRGSRCPCCASLGFNPLNKAGFYLLTCESLSESFTGYGISGDICERMVTHERNLSKSAFVITRQHVWNFQTGASALALENAVKKQFSQASTLGCSIAGFKRESTDAPFDQVKEFIENILQENPEWQLT